MLGPASGASIFISGISLQINHLHDCCGRMTAALPAFASIGAPVDVRTRAGIGFADD
jgi:hypothetical protein